MYSVPSGFDHAEVVTVCALRNACAASSSRCSSDSAHSSRVNTCHSYGLTFRVMPRGLAMPPDHAADSFGDLPVPAGVLMEGCVRAERNAVAMEAAATPPPTQDADTVIAAFRFGWAIAELRGRYRPDVGHAEEQVGTPGLQRKEHALPLSTERSPAEQRIEVMRVVEGLSDRLALTFPSDGKTMFQTLDVPMRALDAGPKKASAWNTLTEDFYNWDKQIQDTLVLWPLLSAAYQLGRGLAETYWELDPTVTDPHDSRSWEVILGSERVLALKRATARLSSFIDPLTIPAVSISLDAWAEVAIDPAWRAAQRSPPSLSAGATLARPHTRREAA